MFWQNERSKLTGLIKNKTSRSIQLITVTLIIYFILTSCNTLYKTGTVDIEVAVPAKMKLPKKYNKIAVKYNNVNVSYNPKYANYFEGTNVLKDSVNLDSMASEVYFDMFINTLKNQFSFDSIVVVEPSNYSGISVIDTTSRSDSIYNEIYSNEIDLPRMAVDNLIRRIEKKPTEPKSKTKIIDPEYGLHSKNEIKDIADSTGAELLLSLDFFASIDGLRYNKRTYTGNEIVVSIVFWSIYDLEEKELIYFYNKLDTVYWNAYNAFTNGNDFKKLKKMLPGRKDAILNAADIAGSNFAEMLVPHWLEVQRMYYKSGHIELKKAEDLMQENKWLDAAEIWKKNVTNKNKSVAAKSMYNMALACEIEGNIDAAIDWTVKSFHIFGSKNEPHYFNCMNYLQILGQRKIDIRTIERQLNPEISVDTIKNE